MTFIQLTRQTRATANPDVKVWVNPEAIATVEGDWNYSEGTRIELICGRATVVVRETPDEVLERIRFAGLEAAS